MKPIDIDLTKLPSTMSTGWVDPLGPFELTYTITITVDGGKKFDPKKLAAALRAAAREVDRVGRSSGNVGTCRYPDVGR